MIEKPIGMEDLPAILESLSPSDYVSTMMPERPYEGQPHTDTGERGRQEVKELTLRDLRDCYVRACFRASGLTPKEWPNSLYDLPWADMDPLAVFGNMSCEIEQRMGIFPNVPVMGHSCGYCEAVFICDAGKQYQCPHDHWQEWCDHMRQEHPEHSD